jgi:hypothetical protein
VAVEAWAAVVGAQVRSGTRERAAAGQEAAVGRVAAALGQAEGQGAVSQGVPVPRCLSEPLHPIPADTGCMGVVKQDQQGNGLQLRRFCAPRQPLEVPTMALRA